MNYISPKEMSKVKQWPKDTIAAGRGHTVALKPDGTVIAVGCVHTVGLKSDGTVVAECDNTYGQCDVSSWRNIRLPSK
ncbi:RCC1 domain-containing protein [Bacillus thuringiensis]|uniref:RCC1 domain-containing protein n=1 Tax=Bacillus thuringiensis TaxID=1428 RepID=UPI002FBD38C4